MTGSIQALAGSGGGLVTNPINASASNSAAGTGSSTAGITFQTDGTISGNAVYVGPTNWYSPTTTGVGSRYWININGAGWVSLAAQQFTNLSGQNNVVNRSVSIALDSAGVTVVATGTLTLSVSNGT